MKGGEGVLDVLLKVAKADAEPTDRLPTTVEELKQSKSGLVSFLFLSGRDKEDIAKELKAAFKLTDDQAASFNRGMQRTGEAASPAADSGPVPASPVLYIPFRC